MGGRGSGRWNQHPKKRLVEHCIAFSPADLPIGHQQRVNTLTSPEGSWTIPLHYVYVRIGDDPMQRINVTFEAGEEGNTKPLYQTLVLQRTNTGSGGHRDWFMCPYPHSGELCGKRVGKLYLPKGATSFGC